MGLVSAGTIHMRRIENMIFLFRDFFGALFFNFGLTIDPMALSDAAWLALSAVLFSIIGNNAAGILSGRSAGLSPKASMNIGLTIVARGGFSIVAANFGAATGLLSILHPFAPCMGGLGRCWRRNLPVSESVRHPASDAHPADR